MKPIVKVVLPLGDVRIIEHSDVYEEDAGDVGQIPHVERKLRNFFAYITSFTSGDAKRVVRHRGDGQELKAWRRSV